MSLKVLYKIKSESLKPLIEPKIAQFKPTRPVEPTRPINGLSGEALTNEANRLMVGRFAQMPTFVKKKLFPDRHVKRTIEESVLS